MAAVLLDEKTLIGWKNTNEYEQDVRWNFFHFPSSLFLGIFKKSSTRTAATVFPLAQHRGHEAKTKKNEAVFVWMVKEKSDEKRI